MTVKVERKNKTLSLDIKLFLAIHYYFFRPKRSLNSKKYGVDLIHYTHASNTAIHSSTKVDGR